MKEINTVCILDHIHIRQLTVDEISVHQVQIEECVRHGCVLFTGTDGATAKYGQRTRNMITVAKK